MARARTPTRRSPAKQPAKATPTAPRPDLAARLAAATTGAQPLAELLAAWQLVPAAELADAIAGVPVDPDLVDVATSNAVDGLARLSRIDPHRDPRTSAMLVGWLAEPPWHATGAQPFYTHLFQRLEAIGDPRAIAQLAAARAKLARVVKGKSMRGWLQTRIDRARAALAARYPDGVPAVTAKERTLVARAAKAAAAAGTPVARPQTKLTSAAAELLAAIRANPRDDAPRHVYADVLVEKGDPRGTFIHMQLARAGREPTADERKAELKLLSKHLRIWLGELVTVAGSAGYHLGVGSTGGWLRFDRGFLVSCMLVGSAKQLRAAAGHPELATVEDLAITSSYKVQRSGGARPMRDACEVVLRDTPMPALSRLHVSTDLLEIALAAPCAQQLVELGVSGLASVVHERAATVPLALHTLVLRFNEYTLAPLARLAIEAALARPTLQRLEATFFGAEVKYLRRDGQWIAERMQKGSRWRDGDGPAFADLAALANAR